MTTKMVPVFRLVPNGLTLEGRLAVTVLVTPVPVSKASGVELDLEHWPSAMAGWFAKTLDDKPAFQLPLFLKKIDFADGKPVCTGTGDPLAAELRLLSQAKPARAGVPPTPPWAAMDQKWQEAFLSALKKCECGDPADIWSVLAGALGKAAENKSFKADVEPGKALGSAEHLAPTLNDNGSSRSGASGQGTDEAIATVLPIGHAAFAAYLETLRGKRVSAAIDKPQVLSRDSVLSQVDYQARLKDLQERRKDNPLPNDRSKDDAADKAALRLEFAKQLKAAYDATVAVRDEMSQRFSELRKNLEQSQCIVPGEVKPTSSIAALTQGSEKMRAQTGIQQYGNWAQAPDDRVKVCKPATSDETEQAVIDAISQAFFALQSSPSLARLFGLTFDAELEIEPVLAILKGTPVDGRFYYGFLGSSQALCADSLGSTAVCLEMDGDTVVSFLPATRAEVWLSPACTGTARQTWLDSSDHYRGLVPLSGCLLPGVCGIAGQRFVLTSLDVRRALDQAMRGDGDRASDQLPEPEDSGQRYATVGFCLNDRRRSMGLLEELAVMQQHRDNPGKPLALYAEDLVVGHVIDVAPDHGAATGADWRCLMERSVHYYGFKHTGTLLATLIGKPWTDRRMHLERARISPATRVMAQPGPSEENSKKDLIVEEAVAVWDGSPMAVDTSPPTGIGQEAMSKTLKSLAAASEPAFVRLLHLPDNDHADKHRPPPLRYGVSYRFGMRCVYAGGGGLSLTQAARRYQQAGNAFALPRDRGQPFLRNESILSPDVLMWPQDAQTAHGAMGYESSLEVLLRSSNGVLDNHEPMFQSKPSADDPDRASLAERTRPQSATRIIMPPSVGMEDAARHWMFDGPTKGADNWQWGALRQLNYSAGYPKCRDQLRRGWNDEQVIVGRKSADYATGQGVAVFSFRKSPSSMPDDRFYPDPAARFLMIGLLRKGTTEYLQPANRPGRLARVAFYRKAVKDTLLKPDQYQSLLPVELKFAIDPSAPQCRLDVATEADYSKGPIGVRTVTITLAAFDEIEVHLWCVPNRQTLERQFALPSYMEGEVRAMAEDLWRHVTEVGPLEELGAVQIISAVHAVNRPTADPVLVFDGPARRVRAPAREGVEASAELMLDGQLKLPAASADSYEIYLSCVSAHSARIDDEQRGRPLSKRRAAQWPDDPRQAGQLLSAKEIFGFAVSANGKVSLPTQTVLLARGDDVPVPQPWGEQLVSLDLGAILRAAGQNPALCPAPAVAEGKVALFHQFADDKARRLFVRAVAIGRYAPLFSTRSTFGDQQDGQRLQRRINPLQAREQSRVGEEHCIWLLANLRPQAPELLSCEPSFSIDRWSSDATGQARLVRHADIRIRIKRPWFSSGEDERLGIVLARAGSAYPQLTGDAAVQTPFSRWGGDPIWTQSAGETELVGFRQFDLQRCRHRYEQIEEYELPMPDNLYISEQACLPMPSVSLLLFEPHFDVDREEWYVDVPLITRVSSDPFVRFALVRYQEHTAEGVENTSPVVECWAKLMPKREVEVSCRYAKEPVKAGELRDLAVEVLVKGLAHDGPRMVRKLTGSDKAVPQMRMQLFHESASAVLQRRPVFLGDIPDAPVYRTASGLHEWKFSTRIPGARQKDLNNGAYVVFLSEFERFLPATYTDDFAEPVNWTDMQDANTLVETGARFSARIELPKPG